MECWRLWGIYVKVAHYFSGYEKISGYEEEERGYKLRKIIFKIFKGGGLKILLN